MTCCQDNFYQNKNDFNSSWTTHMVCNFWLFMPMISIRAYYETSLKADEIQRERKHTTDSQWWEYHQRCQKWRKYQNKLLFSHSVDGLWKEKCFWGKISEGNMTSVNWKTICKTLSSLIVKRPISHVKIKSLVWNLTSS